MKTDFKYYVRVSSCFFTPDKGFHSFMEALDFAIFWNADLLIREEDKLVPICNP